MRAIQDKVEIFFPDIEHFVLWRWEEFHDAENRKNQNIWLQKSWNDTCEDYARRESTLVKAARGKVEKEWRGMLYATYFAHMPPLACSYVYENLLFEEAASSKYKNAALLKYSCVTRASNTYSFYDVSWIRKLQGPCASDFHLQVSLIAPTSMALGFLSLCSFIFVVKEVSFSGNNHLWHDTHDGLLCYWTQWKCGRFCEEQSCQNCLL